MLTAIVSFVGGVVGRTVFDIYAKEWVLSTVAKLKAKFASK